jgi:hypothetical protein
MADPVDAIAERLIEAAYEVYGRPPEAGGEYIHTVTRETDVPAYFRKKVLLARELRSRALWARLQATTEEEANAEFTMRAGLQYLAQDETLPADQRRVIEEIQSLHEWQNEVRKEVEDQAWRDAVERGSALPRVLKP